MYSAKYQIQTQIKIQINGYRYDYVRTSYREV